MPRDLTTQDKRALDAHITREQWDEPWGTVDSDGNPVKSDVLMYVTKTIATIVRDDGSGLHPVEAAFVAIAKDDSDGRFVFTRDNDGTLGRWVVTVERTFIEHKGHTPSNDRG